MDQDIVNAIGCVNSTRLHFDDLRRDGWDKLLDEVNGFYDLHEIDRVEMKSAYIDPKQHRKKLELQTSITMQWISLMMLLIG